jgi:ATP-dependent helicase STH1/SNF2
VLKLLPTDQIYQEYPEYYQMVRRPMSLLHILRRTNLNTYKNVTKYRADWECMFDNARFYNEPGSIVVIDAEEMEVFFDHFVANAGFPSSS